MSRSDVGVVVIGRNEAPRLERSLRSVRGPRTVYVDSGSSDGSVEIARSTGVEVIEVDRTASFTAARGRNAGLERLLADPAIAYIQMLDGDCELAPGWLDAGASALDADSRIGAVFGGLRESRRDASIYHWMCDIEWAVAPGSASAIGGIALLRADAVREIGLYRPDMIAGEDPEIAIRLRAAGWHILALPAPMATHDAAMTGFGQWWRRMVRSGHAFAELVHLHPGSPLHDFARSRRRILFWGGAVPALGLAGLLLSIIADRRWIGLTLAAILLVTAQWLRVTVREMARHPPGKASAFAFFLAIGKYAEMIGMIGFHLGRWRGRNARPTGQDVP